MPERKSLAEAAESAVQSEAAKEILRRADADEIVAAKAVAISSARAFLGTCRCYLAVCQSLGL